jgi:hypothetical protein
VAVQDVGIYFPERSTPIFRFHFREIGGRLSDDWTYYNNAELFNKSTHQRRVACFQVPYPYGDPNYPKNMVIDQEIVDIYDHADIIIFLCSELHGSTAKFIRRHDLPKMRWFMCGKLTPPLLNGRTFLFLDWFTTTIHFYKNVRPSTLYQLNPYDPKPLMFDALLGRKKLHRDRAYNFINEQGLASQGVVTYINNFQDINFQNMPKEEWIWEEPGLTERENVQWTVEPVKYYGHVMSLSQIIPFSIYNQTAYSLVCETNCDNDLVFFTEKTVKPILARRLFVMVACRYSLAMLRDLGFRTFNTIIDESYDEIEHYPDRQLAAMEQLRWLCNQPQEKILAQCRDIVDHNFNLMMGKDWYREFSGTLSHVLFD